MNKTFIIILLLLVVMLLVFGTVGATPNIKCNPHNKHCFTPIPYPTKPYKPCLPLCRPGAICIQVCFARVQVGL